MGRISFLVRSVKNYLWWNYFQRVMVRSVAPPQLTADLRRLRYVDLRRSAKRSQRKSAVNSSLVIERVKLNACLRRRNSWKLEGYVRRLSVSARTAIWACGDAYLRNPRRCDLLRFRDCPIARPRAYHHILPSRAHVNLAVASITSRVRRVIPERVLSSQLCGYSRKGIRQRNQRVGAMEFTARHRRQIVQVLIRKAVKTIQQHARGIDSCTRPPRSWVAVVGETIIRETIISWIARIRPARVRPARIRPARIRITIVRVAPTGIRCAARLRDDDWRNGDSVRIFPFRAPVGS